MQDIIDIHIKNGEDIVRETARVTGKSVSEIRRIYKAIKDTRKKFLRMGYGVREAGLIDQWPAERNMSDGRVEIVYRAKAASILKKPDRVRKIGETSEIRTISDEELLMDELSKEDSDSEDLEEAL